MSGTDEQQTAQAGSEGVGCGKFLIYHNNLECICFGNQRLPKPTNRKTVKSCGKTGG